jgi:outer membrane lipoprotein-sorting protein
MPRHRAALWSRLLLCVPLLLTCCLVASGEEAGETDVPPRVREVLQRVDEANEELENVTARVTYLREIPLLDEVQKSRGTLIFREPDKIVLRLGRPRNEDVYTDGETWWVVSHDDRQVEIYQAAEDSSREAAFLEFGYGKGSEALLDDYSVELLGEEQAEEDGEEVVRYRLRFTPREQEDKPARYAAIEVEVSSHLWLPDLLVLHESGGEILHTYSLAEIRINSDVDEDVFECEIPRGYTILRPAES